jgi:CRP/FNR family cyclic AMP-dependent transcriptional regulator
MHETLISHPFAKGLSEQELSAVATGAQEVEFRPDDLIFREGESAHRFYLIQEGQVALEACNPGEDAVVIQNIHAGGVLGWSWLFAPFTWHFQARALEHTKAIALDGGHLLRLCEEDPALGYPVMKRVAQVAIERLQATRRQLLISNPHSATLTAEHGELPCAETKSLQRAVAEHPFLAGMSEKQLKTLVAHAMQVRFDAGELVFKTGDPANRFYLIEHGRVALESQSTHNPVPIQVIGDGEVLGWSWLFDPYLWHFNARVLRPTAALFFYGTRLRLLCESEPDLGYEMIKRITQVVIQRLQAAREQLLAVA